VSAPVITAPAAPGSAAVADAVIAQYSVAQAKLRSHLLAMLSQLWGSVTSYGDAEAQKFVHTAVPLVAGAQRATATLTTAYLARLDAIQSGRPVRLPSLDPNQFVGDAVRDADPDTVYARPFVVVRRALADGKDLDQAVAAGGQRLNIIAATDVQLSKTHASQAVLSQMPDVDGYRRVLKGSASCGLCIVAATQRYHKEDLAAIHPGCDCGVAPLKAGQDIGQVISPTMLKDAHAAIQERFGKSSAGAREVGTGIIGPDGKPLLYKDVLITHEHGEIGPVLGVRGQKFTGPDDLHTAVLDHPSEAAPEPTPEAPKARVSEETARHIEQARQGFPLTAGEWNAITTPVQRVVDRQIADIQQEVDKLQAELDKVTAETQAEFKAKRTPKYMRRDILHDRTWQLESNIRVTESQLAHQREIAAMDTQEAEDKGVAFLLRTDKGDSYERDDYGNRLAPAELNKHLDTVLSVGEKIHGDFAERMFSDPELERLQELKDSARIGEHGDATKAYRARQQTILHELLGSVRSMGGHQQAVTAGDAAVRPDFVDVIREAERVFPTAWLVAADKRGPLNAVHSDRAYFLAQEGKADILAMSTDAYDPNSAFSSYPAEVTAHELGHRMERTIPGLTHLEFALVRRRALDKHGDLPQPSALSAVTGSTAYRPDEVTLPDEWPDPYAGKTYEHRDPTDPAAQSWELFQVSLQDTWGRGDRVYAGLQGQIFALGVLALLGEE
jgi:hypothetical protein